MAASGRNRRGAGGRRRLLSGRHGRVRRRTRPPRPIPAAPPTGTHAHAAPTGPSAPLAVGERFTTLTVPRAYTPRPPDGGTDEYRCFLVDPGLRSAGVPHRQPVPARERRRSSTTRSSSGSRRPTSRPPVSSTRSDPGDGWTCFGGTGIGGDDPARALGDDWVAAWAPGGLGEERYPGRHRLPVAAGRPAGPAGALQPARHRPAGPSDQPGIRLRLAPGQRAAHPAADELLPAPVELPCPDGSTGRPLRPDAGRRST